MQSNPSQSVSFPYHLTHLTCTLSKICSPVLAWCLKSRFPTNKPTDSEATGSPAFQVRIGRLTASCLLAARYTVFIPSLCLSNVEHDLFLVNSKHSCSLSKLFALAGGIFSQLESAQSTSDSNCILIEAAAPCRHPPTQTQNRRSKRWTLAAKT
jgi:hypothetical protein